MMSSSFLFPSEQLSRITPSEKVVRKIPVFRPPCPHVAYPLPLWSSSSSISHYFMVLQCHIWCSVNTLLIDLIMTCSSKQRHNRQSSCKQQHTESQTDV